MRAFRGKIYGPASVAAERTKQLDQPSSRWLGDRGAAKEKNDSGKMNDRQGDQATRSTSAIVSPPDFEIEILIL
jgi:hypothetical protein